MVKLQDGRTWVKLASGEYVRHNFIVSVRIGDSEPMVAKL